MWIYDRAGNIINGDYIKAIHIEKKTVLDSLGYSGLREYVVCAADVTLNSRIVIWDFNEKDEAQKYIFKLEEKLNYKTTQKK